MRFSMLTQGKKFFVCLFVACLLTALPAQVATSWAMDDSDETKFTLPNIGATDATVSQNLINKLGDNLYILDVRNPHEFASGHIPKAINIALANVEESLDKIPTDRPILIVCRSGSRAQSAWAIIHVARPNQEKVWYFSGFPVYSSDGSYKFQ